MTGPLQFDTRVPPPHSHSNSLELCPGLMKAESRHLATLGGIKRSHLVKTVSKSIGERRGKGAQREGTPPRSGPSGSTGLATACSPGHADWERALLTDTV